MLSFALWKKLAVFGALALGLLYAVPNFIDAPEEGGLASILPGQSVNLGLDLQGGSYLLLKVDMEKVERGRLSDIAENLRSYLRSQRAGFNGLKSDDKQTVFRLRKEEDKQKLTQFFNELGRDFNVTNDNLSYQIAYTEEGLFALAGRTVEQSIEIVRKRLDPDGTKEPLIQRQGKDRILIQLPGVDDPERIKRLIGRTAKLSFQLVDPRISASEARQQGRVPPGSILLEGMKEGEPAYVVEKLVMVSGEDLETASASFDENNRPSVSFQLTSTGGRKFGRVTGENIGRAFAIVLDGKVVSAPVIQSQIFPNGQITGNFSIQETQELSLILRAGALPAPLIVLEERSVGPGLGADSIEAGKIAVIVGFILVMGYMVLSYGLFGLFADLALLGNIVLILGALSALQATLTLPGIAGIVLTMGMAVDANVLIFERIREELRKGSKVRAAIEEGYARAISTIIDANLTTLFAALFLYAFGSGPVRGFAVTLSLGIFTSMFTAIMLTRLFIVLWANRTRPTSLAL